MKFAQGLPDNSSFLCDENDHSQGKYSDQLTSHSATDREPTAASFTLCRMTENKVPEVVN